MEKEKATATALARTNLWNTPVIGRGDAKYALEPGEAVEIVEGVQEVASTSNDTNKANATFIQVKKSLGDGKSSATGWVIKSHLEISGVAATTPA